MSAFYKSVRQHIAPILHDWVQTIKFEECHVESEVTKGLMVPDVEEVTAVCAMLLFAVALAGPSTPPPTTGVKERRNNYGFG